MSSNRRIYLKEDIEVAVKESINFSEVCRKLGITKPKGGSYQLIQSRVKEYGFDTSHFKGKRTLCGKNNPNYNKRKTVEEILVEGCKYRQNHKLLKRAMFEVGVEYKCSCCGIAEWNNKPITLDIDHINGDWTNCKIENLRFLCPNCHRQTDTFGAKNIRN